MIKIAFFDIDGTLLSPVTHRMLDSTKEALARMRAQGIKTVISSGRAVYELPPCCREGFDAYITMNGQLCLDADHRAFRDVQIARLDVRAIVGQVLEGRYDVLVKLSDRLFVNRLSADVEEIARQANLIYEVDDVRLALERPVYQFCAFLPAEQECVLLGATQAVTTTRWSHLFCDVIPADGGKAHGVAAVLERLGVRPEEAVAFGDGENDVSMFDMVGTSVAMGNAWDNVKQRADLVTDDASGDGIWNACVNLGLV